MDTPVQISRDGRNYMSEAGSIVRIKFGESITIPTGLYHKF